MLALLVSARATEPQAVGAVRGARSAPNLFKGHFPT